MHNYTRSLAHDFESRFLAIAFFYVLGWWLFTAMKCRSMSAGKIPQTRFPA
jgi:hypothetical protein